MRASAIALVAALGLAVAGPAEARTWTDPAGRLTLDLPSGWSQETRNCDGCTFVDAFNPSRDCYVLAKPRAQAIPSARVRKILTEDTPVTDAVWTSNANDFQSVFPNDSATFVSRSLDAGGFWPVQRAEFTNADGKHIHGGMQMRPSVEIWGFCVAAAGDDRASDYDAFFRGMGTPQDAQLQTEVQAAEAAADAQAAQGQAQQQQQQQPQQQQGGRRNTHGDHAEDH
ncbi:MAG TPA: hypothetical protein VG841_02805 [Caulobacterales bacterium]|nr:hypothetical protein [Caulobacterales bacterium]